jgi:lipid II:glycine glycyltransferase (peptidoglycan interpeptide bridge formation enzyme)
MEVKEIQNKDIWENFLLGCSEKSFLQSWNWGEFQKMMGNKIWRFGIFFENELISLALVVKVTAKRGTFLLVPHGPIIQRQETEDREQILRILLEELKKIAKEERIDFIRINPIWPRSQKNTEVFKKIGFRSAPIQVHPEASWKLDLAPSEEGLLKNMRKTTRYLIRQALKNQDIELYQGREGDIKIFSNLHNKVSKRQHFVPFSFEYLKNEFLVFQKDNQVLLLFAKYRGEIGAGCFVILWSGIGFYHHAVSLPEYSKLSLPYFLQWEAIKEAKRRGCRLYDFWGFVDPQKQPRHPWAGPTLFKMGFGGRAHEYVETQDFPLSKKYWLTFFFEKLRHWRRGF